MRVIEEGKVPEITCEVRCKYCETLFEVLPQDVYKKSYGSFGLYKVECPTCKQTLDISTNKTSSGKKLELEEKFYKFCITK